MSNSLYKSKSHFSGQNLAKFWQKRKHWSTPKKLFSLFFFHLLSFSAYFLFDISSCPKPPPPLPPFFFLFCLSFYLVLLYCWWPFSFFFFFCVFFFRFFFVVISLGWRKKGGRQRWREESRWGEGEINK